MHALLALALLVQSPFQVDTLQPAGGPQVLWHHDPSPLVALRLSVPLPADLPAGAAELLQELARPAATERAEALGASLAMRITPGAAVVALTGPAATFDGLVAILRGVASEPDLAMVSLRRARARAGDRALADLETPSGRLRALLRAELTGHPAGVFSMEALPPDAVRQLAGHLLDPRRLRVVVVGAVPEEILRSAFAGWGPAPDQPAMPPWAAAASLPAPQADHEWAALAYPLPFPAATLSVAAALVESRMRAAGLRGGRAEVWAGPGGPALLLVGATRPGDTAVATAARITDFPRKLGDRGPVRPLPRYLRRLMAEAAALASPTSVTDAAAATRDALLMEARTAAGRAEVIGRFADAASGSGTGGPQSYVDALDTVSIGAVQRALTAALAAPALFAEVRP